MDDDVTEHIRILLDLEQEAHDRAARKSAREIVRLEKAYDPLSRATIRYQADQKKLNAALEKGTINAARHAALMNKVQAEYDQTAAKVSRLNVMQAANSTGQKTLFAAVSRNKAAFQQLGYQVGDFAVQVQGGTSVITAFTQQGSQLLGVLGAYGAIAGAALAVGAPLIASFFRSGDEAKKAKDPIEELASAVSTYRDAAEKAVASGKDLSEVYGDQAENMREMLEFQARLDRMTALAKMNDAAGKVRDSLADVREILADVEASVDLRKVYGSGEERAAAVEKMFARERGELALTAAEARKLLDVLDALAASKGTDETIAAAQDLLDLFIEIFGSVEKIPAQFQQAAKEAAAIVGEATEIRKVSNDLLGIWNSLPDMAKGFADQLARALGFAEGLSGITLDGVLGKLGLPGAGQWMRRAEGMQSAVDLIQSKEGYREKAYWDHNHWRVGYGSDTMTDADGTTRSVQKGDTTTPQAADRDLKRRVGIYFNQIISELGIDHFNALPAAQQGALASLLHNYGAGEFRAGGDLGKVLEALKSRNDELVAQRIIELGGGGHSGRVGESLKARRREEARAFGRGSAAIEEQNAAAQAAREAAKATEDEARANDRAKDSFDNLRGSIDPLTAAAQRLAKAKAVVAEALKRNQITADEARAAYAALDEEYERTVEAINNKKALDAFKDIRAGVDSLSESLIKTAVEGGKVGDVLRKFLMDAAIKAAAKNLSESIMGIMNIGGGAGGGFFGSILGALFGSKSAQGNVFSGGTVKPFADGGVVGGPTTFPMPGGKVGLMGEAGPEAIMPLTRIGGKLGVRADTRGSDATSGEIVIRVQEDGSLQGYVQKASGTVALKVVNDARGSIVRDSVDATYRTAREVPLP